MADSSLGPKEREGFKITIRWYLSWCARNSVGCSVGSARDFIEWAEEEKQPTEWMLKRWNASILKVMRRCGMALKTERSYVGAYRNFVRQTGVARGAAIEARHLKSYLDYWRMAWIYERFRICLGTPRWKQRKFTHMSCKNRALGCAVRSIVFNQMTST